MYNFGFMFDALRNCVVMSENAIDINGKLVKDFDNFDKMSKKEFVVRLEGFY